MRLENSRGEFLELRILEYEYPIVNNDKWDSNWLNIEISVNHSEGNWIATEPCLLTFEIRKLADWLEKISIVTEQAESTLEFVEPNLIFSLVNIRSNLAIRVYFELEVRPTWRPAKAMKKAMKDLWIDFPLEKLDLNKAIYSLRSQLEYYPERDVG